MTLFRATRNMLGLRSRIRAMVIPRKLANIPTMAPACSRCFYRGPWRDPFTHMEEFMKDMERKFKRDIDSSLSSFFRDVPRVVGSQALDTAPVITKPGFGHVQNISTEDRYKLAFNFFDAKPEDIKVALKGRTLTVSGKAESSTETSQVKHAMSVEYQLPEEVDVDALESSLSHDGILTIEAPQTPPKGPETSQTINIKREE
uniref:Heat shock protein n=1 Tax=Cherax destructor TaxID=6723 RepID=A0A0E3X6Z3_CHEDE|nr:heat shock protein [Cherax destructor]WLO59328.1 heat shock protein 20 [Cherax destructor]